MAAKEASNPSYSAVSELIAASVALTADDEVDAVAGETSRQAQMSSAGGAMVPGDAGHTAVLAALGRVDHSTWTAPAEGMRTTDDPEHHAAASESRPENWIVASDNLRLEGIAGDSWPLGWPCCRWRWALPSLLDVSDDNCTYACRQGRGMDEREGRCCYTDIRRDGETAYLMKGKSRWHYWCCKD